jgi:hypothetical protein
MQVRAQQDDVVQQLCFDILLYRISPCPPHRNSMKCQLLDEMRCSFAATHECKSTVCSCCFVPY